MMTALALLGRAVLHGAWLGLAAAALVGLALRHLPITRPQRRCTVALAALLALPPAALALAALPPTALGPGPSSVPALLAPTLSLAPALPWLGLAWALGAAWGVLCLFGALARLARLRRRARPLAAAERERLLGRARRHLGHHGQVELARSADVAVPTVIGWRRPLVVLPGAALDELPGDDLEWLLVHELAHVRRHDIAWNWAQSLAERAFFFHPAARWLAAQVRHERECCCDLDVARRPDALAPYARALARLASIRSPHIQSALAATGGSLVSRMQRIIDPHHLVAAPSRAVSLALALAAAATATLVVACDDEPPAPREWSAPAQFTDAQGVVTQLPAGAEDWVAADAQPAMKFIDEHGAEHLVPAGAPWVAADAKPAMRFIDEHGAEHPVPAGAPWVAAEPAGDQIAAPAPVESNVAPAR